MVIILPYYRYNMVILIVFIVVIEQTYIWIFNRQYVLH